MDIQLIDEPLLIRGSMLPRSEGLHVSQIYRDLYMTLWPGKLRDTDTGEIDDQGWQRMEAGFYWEDVFSTAWADREEREGVIFRTEELIEDGVYASPDGLWVPRLRANPLTLEEYKFTWYSSNRAPEDNWLWMTQIKAYLYALGLNEANLRVYYCMGDYRGSGPQYKRFKITVPDWEKEENWTMLINHARSRGWL